MVVHSQSTLKDGTLNSQELKIHKGKKSSSLLTGDTAPVAVLFDWDNTLVDTWKTIFYALNDTLLAFGLEPWSEEFAIASVQQSGRDAFPKLFGEKSKEAQKFFYKLVEEDNLQGLNPMPEAQELLEILAEKGIPMGIVSNKNSTFLHKEVNHLGWKNYFGALVGAGDATRDKPAADPIFLALKNLNVSVSPHVWMVGDAPVDWDCALAAGCQAIAIGNRFEHPSSVLVSIENCSELKKIFSKM
ncbi:MAG: HAD family hydrolase [Alphaproteobacteria bacterium]|nr:HAD family hydrolase [Alphaproteobacteria bacterium]